MTCICWNRLSWEMKASRGLEEPMDAAGGALEGGASARVVIDRAEIPESLKSGSDGGRQHLAGVSPPTVIESSEGEPPGNSGRPTLVNARDLSGNSVEDESEQNVQNVSTVMIGDQDLEKGLVKTKTVVETYSVIPPSHHRQHSEEDSQCRVCHMSTATADAINLGCNCKLDLGRAHKGCAEKWFKIRGNLTCEICGEIAQNVQLVSDSFCHVDDEDQVTVIVDDVQRGRDARMMFLRSAAICLVWVAIIIFLYKYLLPIIRKVRRGSVEE